MTEEESDYIITCKLEELQEFCRQHNDTTMGQIGFVSVTGAITAIRRPHLAASWMYTIRGFFEKQERQSLQSLAEMIKETRQ